MAGERNWNNKMPAANTAQKSNAGLCLRAEQFNHLKSANKCYAFSLSLSGTAFALGTLGANYNRYQNRIR
jgi:hypothetical protein